MSAEVRNDLSLGDGRFFIAFALSERSTYYFGFPLPRELICAIVIVLVLREDLVFLAKLCEQAERYGEMLHAMKRIAYHYGNLTVLERNLLSVSFKNVIGMQRASWRILCSIQEKERKSGVTWKADRTSEVIVEVEQTMLRICYDAISLITEHIVPFERDSKEAVVFYHKMLGDYYRYLAEICDGIRRAHFADHARNAYAMASEIALLNLPATHPIRLGLMLNFAVFYYEIDNNPNMACKVQKESFDLAISELDSLTEESYKDSTIIMQLLRDSLTLWTSDQPDDEDGIDG